MGVKQHSHFYSDMLPIARNFHQGKLSLKQICNSQGEIKCQI